MKIEWDVSELNTFAKNLSDVSKFDREIKFAAKEIASVLLKLIKFFTPIGETYQLINGWNGNAFLVRQVPRGFEVEIVNTTPYALDVNDGHTAHNQYGGPYPIRKRVKVKNAKQWQEGDPTFYVFGHFFVERGILQLNNRNQIEKIIMQKLQKWWDSV